MSPAATPSGGSNADLAAVADAMIVDERAQLAPGQMVRDQFLSQLREQVIVTANEALGPVWSTVGCPYIESWFSRNAATSAADLERLARRYSGVATPRAATEYFGPILARIRDGIARWKAGEDVAGDVAAAGLSNGTSLAPQAQLPDRGGAVKKKSAGAAGSEPRSPDAVLAALGPGRAMEGNHASRLGAAMDDNFGEVRVHTDSVAAHHATEFGARAFTVGSHVAFAAGEYRPGTPVGDGLLAHELAHVQQQRGAAQGPEPKKHGDETTSDETYEVDADSAAAGVLTRLYGAGAGLAKGARSIAGVAVDRARAVANSGLALQRCKGNSNGKEDAGAQHAAKQDTPLVAEVKQAIAANDGAAVLRKLRGTTSATQEEQEAITAAIEGAGKTTLSDDDKWLAKHLLAGNTADPTAAPTDESRMFTDPDPDPGTMTPIQTEVHMVPGRTTRRALVIGGVHGSEPEGTVVVVQLIEALKKAKTKPFFTVVLVPKLIDKSRQDPSPKSGNDAYREVDDKTAKGSAGATSKGTKSEGNIEVEPNRNFPLPGKSYGTYKKEGHLEFWDKENDKVRAPHDKHANQVKAVASEKMLPENRILVHLIEQFQPERLASVHQHKLPGARGDGPGVFVDPRRPAIKLSADDGIDLKDQAITPEGQQDDKLAVAMRDAVQQGAEAAKIRKEGRDPLAGNAVPLAGAKSKQSPTVHYRTTAHAEGNSLGDWAPVEVKGGGTGDRPAIGTFTIELPQYKKSDKDQATALAKLEAIEVTTLQSIFLEDPSKITP